MCRTSESNACRILYLSATGNSSSYRTKKTFSKNRTFFQSAEKFHEIFKFSFWVSLIVTVVSFIYSLNMLSELNDEREEAQVIEQQKQDIMEKTFAVLSTQANIDEIALQAIFQEYIEQLEYLAVFSTKNIDDFSRHLTRGRNNYFSY